MPQGLDDKLVVELWEVVGRELRKRARTQRMNPDFADEVLQEAMAQLLTAAEKHEIHEPIHWLRKAAAHVWQRLDRRMKTGISLSNAVIEMTEKQDQTTEFHSGTIQEAIASLERYLHQNAPETQDPALIAEQRELIQMIDPQWREHMEEELDGTRGHKMDYNEARVIRRRAKKLLEES